MGQKLLEYYTKAEELAGLRAKIRFAVITKMTSTQAKVEADSTDNISAFEAAMNALKQEFATGTGTGSTHEALKLTLPGESQRDSENRLRKHIKVFVELMGQRSLFMGNLAVTSKRVTETIVHTLDVERASIWFFNESRTRIECSDLFVKKEAKHSSGVILKASDFPTYFKGLESERTIAAHDAHLDPRTREFSEAYLKPLGINSMLDVPIWVDGKMIGVVCHEHVGPQRTWIADEENFAFLMANFVALTVENQSKS